MNEKPPRDGKFWRILGKDYDDVTPDERKFAQQVRLLTPPGAVAANGFPLTRPGEWSEDDFAGVAREWELNI